MRENDGIVEFKGLVLTQNNEKTSKKCQNQLYQNSRKSSNAYSFQENAENRKMQQKLSRRALWYLHLALISSLSPGPQLSCDLEDSSLSLVWVFGATGIRVDLALKEL